MSFGAPADIGMQINLSRTTWQSIKAVMLGLGPSSARMLCEMEAETHP